MVIDLDSVGKTAKPIAMVFDPAEIDLESEDGTLTGPAEFTGETQRINGRAHIRGTVNADLLVECTRCLESVAKHIEASFDDVFVNASEEPYAGEIEVSGEKLDESLVPDGKVDMVEVVREQILLALPIQVLCREDCKGLCPKCGADRNLIDCKCADDEIDPRWAALKGLN
jgi:uncharacterized protein